MIPSHRAPDHDLPTWKYERAGILLLACPIVCAFDRACIHSFCKRSVSKTVYVMKFTEPPRGKGGNNSTTHTRSRT